MVAGQDRVMHPVHVRGDDDAAQPAVEPFGNGEVAVIELRSRVQQHLENQHGDDYRHRVQVHGF